MGSTKKTPAKAGKSAVKAHHARGNRDLSRSFSPEVSEINSPSEASPGPSRSSAPHLPPTMEERKKNGRVEGRNLIPWSRPRMADKLLLHIMYETTRHRIDVPWDAIAHRFHPGSTGGAIMQHLNRLRGILVAEGHLVPPIVQKPGSKVYVDPKIRGYVRKYPESEDMTTSRPVSFEEVIEDPKYNLPDAFEGYRQPTSAKREARLISSPRVATPGSSRASSALKAPIKGSTRTSGILKDLTASNSSSKKTPVKTPVKKTPAKKASPRKASARKVEEEEDEELDIKEENERGLGFDSDSEFDPTHESASKVVRRSSRPRKVARSYAEEEIVDDEEAAEDSEDNLGTVGGNAAGRSTARSQGDGHDDDADADAGMEDDVSQYIKSEHDAATATAVTGRKSPDIIEVDNDSKAGKRVAGAGHSDYEHMEGNGNGVVYIPGSEDEENDSLPASHNAAHQTPQTPRGHGYHHHDSLSFSSPIAASKARSAILDFSNGMRNGIPNGMPGMDLETMMPNLTRNQALGGSRNHMDLHPGVYSYTGQPVTAFARSNDMHPPPMIRRNSGPDGLGFQTSSEDSFERSSPAMSRENGYFDNTVNPADVESFHLDNYFHM
ncbi:hypothetical protein B0T19DRAFT_478138 [Cercophora scortea]|uniref:Uncharacterized protein n=1 Tax=Cercophora scortea TaxID=314031 RepID=A0AAE0I9A5_9PEZI|nr:hypothetical protein B0T19DRAFT_478138 [Cercophora scortea]